MVANSEQEHTLLIEKVDSYRQDNTDTIYVYTFLIRTPIHDHVEMVIARKDPTGCLRYRLWDRWQPGLSGIWLHMELDSLSQARKIKQNYLVDVSCVCHERKVSLEKIDRFFDLNIARWKKQETEASQKKCIARVGYCLWLLLTNNCADELAKLRKELGITQQESTKALFSTQWLHLFFCLSVPAWLYNYLCCVSLPAAVYSVDEAAVMEKLESDYQNLKQSHCNVNNQESIDYVINMGEADSDKKVQRELRVKMLLGFLLELQKEQYDKVRSQLLQVAGHFVQSDQMTVDAFEFFLSRMMVVLKDSVIEDLSTSVSSKSRCESIYGVPRTITVNTVGFFLNKNYSWLIEHAKNGVMPFKACVRHATNTIYARSCWLAPVVLTGFWAVNKKLSGAATLEGLFECGLAGLFLLCSFSGMLTKSCLGPLSVGRNEQAFVFMLSALRGALMTLPAVALAAYVDSEYLSNSSLGI